MFDPELVTRNDQYWMAEQEPDARSNCLNTEAD